MQSFYAKGPHRFLGSGSRATRAQRTSDIPNRINYCIYKCKCGRGLETRGPVDFRNIVPGARDTKQNTDLQLIRSTILKLS